MQLKDRLTELMSHKHNFKNYREALKSCQLRGINGTFFFFSYFYIIYNQNQKKKKAIPNLSVSLSDLVFVDEGNSDYLSFEKMGEGGKGSEEGSGGGGGGGGVGGENESGGGGVGDSGNLPLKNEIKLINFEKCIQIHSIITQVLDFQRVEFYKDHSVDYEIRHWILHSWKPLSQEESYKRSVTIEPKNTEEAIENLLMEQEKQKILQKDLLIKISELENLAENIEKTNNLLNTENQQLRKRLKEKELEKNVRNWAN